MVSFLQSSAALAATTTLLSSLATSDAYARFYMSPTRPSSALGYTSGGRRGSLFSNDMRRVMNNMDSMMDSMLDEMMVDPYSLTRSRMRSRPLSYLLQGSTPSSRRALAGTSRPNLSKQQNNNVAPRYGITQDEKHIQLALEVPAGATANDINLSLEENDRILKISGEATQEEEGISVQSSFNRSFTLGRNVDTDNISASLDNGVLKINAPKLSKEETVRHIDIVENKAIESGEETAVKEEVKEEVPQGEKAVDEVVPQEKVETTASADESIKIDDSVIDLDENKE